MPYMNLPNAKTFRSFADLTKHHKQGRDYDIVILKHTASKIAVIAPHGGAIERRTSEIARAIAADDFHLYLFEGIRESENYNTLHLTSHFFDEPKCLALIETCPYVISIHGCIDASEKVFVGGLNIPLKNHLSIALRKADVPVETTGHQFPAIEPSNICNRGSTGKGVQLEFSTAIRGSIKEPLAIQAIRSVLLEISHAV